MVVGFEDFLPAMAEKLGAQAFIGELSNGFRLLRDEQRGLITFESLKRSSALLGCQSLGDEELICMVREGDLDGDGALSLIEFCILMFKLSPALMNGSQRGLVEALLQEF